MLGQSISTIQQEMGISRGSVTNIRREHKQDVFAHVSPAAKHWDKLKPEVRPLVEWTPDAFEEFFNRYSPWQMASHSRKFVEEAITDHRRVLLNTPPRHAKSRLFSIFLPIWLIARNRDVRILLLSKTRELALEFTREIAAHLESNHFLVRDFGRFKPEVGVDLDHSYWRPKTGQLEVAGRQKLLLHGSMTLEAFGSMQHIIGRGVDWIIADDVVDLANSSTPEQRDKLSVWWRQEVISRLEPGGRIVVIGTRVAEEDLYGELSRKKVKVGEPQLRWHHINFPAVSDEIGRPVNDFVNGHPLWPERFPLNEVEQEKLGYSEWDDEFTNLESIYEDMGEGLWDRTYQQVAAADADKLLKPIWLTGGSDGERMYPGCYEDREVGPMRLEDGWARVVSVDPSGTKFWAMIVADVEAVGSAGKFNARLLDMEYGKLQVQDARQILDQIADVYRPQYLVFEKNAFARWFVEDDWAKDWSRRYRIRMVDHETGRNKNDIRLGVDAMAGDFEFGRIKIPHRGHLAETTFAPLVNQLLMYPHMRADDAVLALWFVKNKHQLFRATPKDTGPIPFGYHLPERVRSHERMLIGR